MEIPLSKFELNVLNRAIHTQILSNPQMMQFALHNMIDDHKEDIMAQEGLSEQEFKVLQTNAAKNIFQFLRANEFFYEREGGAFFLTEKVKHLREQGSIQAYYEWLPSDMARKAEEMKIIEQRGYLDKDQDPAEHRDNLWKETKDVDYDVLHERDPSVHHNHMPAHKFEGKPGNVSDRMSGQRRSFYPWMAVLLVIALFLLARFLKVI